MNATKIICKSVFAPKYSASGVSLYRSSLFNENLQWTIFILDSKEEHVDRCSLHCSLECTRCTHAWRNMFCSKQLRECRSIYITQSVLEAENVIDFKEKWSAWMVTWCTELLGLCVGVHVCARAVAIGCGCACVCRVGLPTAVQFLIYNQWKLMPLKYH